MYGGKLIEGGLNWGEINQIGAKLVTRTIPGDQLIDVCIRTWHNHREICGRATDRRDITPRMK